jgi:hypothetical protein
LDRPTFAAVADSVFFDAVLDDVFGFATEARDAPLLADLAVAVALAVVRRRAALALEDFPALAETRTALVEERARFTELLFIDAL